MLEKINEFIDRFADMGIFTWIFLGFIAFVVGLFTHTLGWMLAAAAIVIALKFFVFKKK